MGLNMSRQSRPGRVQVWSRCCFSSSCVTWDTDQISTPLSVSLAELLVICVYVYGCLVLRWLEMEEDSSIHMKISREVPPFHFSFSFLTCALAVSLSLSADNSIAVKVACYILIGVGAFSMLMGFVGCLGAVYEIRCLLGLVSKSLGGRTFYLMTFILKSISPKLVNYVSNQPPN